jgi:DNA-binding beta-propeller fold protein YncE
MPNERFRQELGARDDVAACLSFVVAAFLAAPHRLHAAPLEGIDWLSGALYDVDQTTGQLSNPRATGIPGPGGIALSPNDGMLYSFRAQVSSASRLYKINPTTGASTAVGSMGAALIEGDLAFDPTSGTLYAMYGSGGSLRTVNTSTGATSAVGSMSYTLDASAMTFDNSGLLYVFDGTAGVLFTVDKTNGNMLSQTSTSLNGLGSVSGMDFDPATGTLYVATGEKVFVGPPNSLYTLNTSTGAMALVGSYAGSLSGLQFVPEPGTITLLASACAVIGAVSLLRSRRVARSNARV